MIKDLNITLDNKLDIVKNEVHYTWIINSTGSNTVGTSFSPDLEQYLLNKGFKKIFSGSPMYATSIGYNEDEIEEICCFIMEMRKKYGQKLEQIQSSYMPGSYLKTIKYKR